LPSPAAKRRALLSRGNTFGTVAVRRQGFTRSGLKMATRATRFTHQESPLLVFAVEERDS